MKKKISFSTDGSLERVGNFNIKRILPNRYADAIGSFVFLDYLLAQHRPVDSSKGVGAHPHRGIATLTYLLSGKAFHYDSMGNKGVISSGGTQWMKAGKGVMHDEVLVSESNDENDQIHGFQFWINLPPPQKKENPEYLSVSSEDLPAVSLSENSFLKVILGQYEGFTSPVPLYKEMFLYHIHLSPHSDFQLALNHGTESGLFIINGPVDVNDEQFQNGEFLEMDREEGLVEIKNDGDTSIGVLIFGGEPYTDPIVADGPFVMNSTDEIRMAYRDFMGGKYGKVTY